MSETTNSQTADFLQNGPWDELYVLTKYWNSDLEFYRDDLRFLHRLIDKYFVWIVKTENLERVNKLKKELSDLKKKGKDLLAKVGKHSIQLGYLVEEPNKPDAGIVITEHEHLEEEMSQFVQSFRENRRDVFAITEYIIDSEKLASLVET